MNFDQYANQYDEHLQRGVSLSGEGKEFFAQGRLRLVHEYFSRIAFHPQSAMDFGCGTGTNTKIMKDLWPSCKMVGLDNSTISLHLARQRVVQEDTYFMTPEEFRKGENHTVDWVFCNGVFHHIDVEMRNEIFRSILEHLRPGGIFTLFDNNPFNPGARWVMHRIPFDRDCQMLNPYKVKLRLAELGFENITCRFLFIFPRFLSCLRLLEPSMSGLPLGAQFGLFARRSPRDD